MSLLNKLNGTIILNKKDFISRLRKILGFRPGNARLYEAAFIHRSASYVLPGGKRINNERLEYLGDAVLDAILSDFLFDKYPESTEGFMTKIRSRIVNRDVLNQLAVSMGINEILISNVSASHPTKNLYGDALEALIGSVFIDKGFNKTKKVFIDKVLNRYLDLDKIISVDTDYKSLVFEWVQKNKAALMFEYNEEYDSDNKKTVFTAALSINRELFGRGQGDSKKEAEQEASGQAWKRIKDISNDFI
ncbi:MAG: ribonuclease III [Bacteroidales bacterium]